MAYFTEEVLPTCQACVLLPFRDGRWGAGVAKEVAWFLDRGFPVWSISPDGRLAPVTQMPYYKVILTVEQTRERLRDADGNMLPF